MPLHMDDNSHSIERDSNVGELDTGSRPIPAVTNGDDLNRIEHSMRDVRYNPDRHRAFPEGSLESSLARDKYFLLSNLNGHRPSSFQTKQIQEINRKLLLSSKDVVERLQQERESIRLRIHRTSIQTDREFPWFLFPHAELIPKLHQVFSHPRSDPSEEPVP
ncbi:MAG: hypothetical protein FJ267_02940 [Planctomycetes bacterium]|nr:hypothetical protein [Planctomycetota bacterium]